jgi:integrase
MNYLSTLEVSKDLGIPKRTVQSYCKEGFLPALVSLNKGKPCYKIEAHSYLNWKNKNFKGIKRGKFSKHTSSDREIVIDDLKSLAQIWLEWCASGKLTGKPLGKRTIEIYEYYFTLYIKGLGKYPSKPLISVDNLRNVLGSYQPQNYSTKRNIYDAIMSFTKYLIELDKFSPEIRNKLKALKPKRYLPAKKTSLNETQLKTMIAACNEMKTNYYGRLSNKVIVVFLANTGLRAFEFCKLKLEDINLEAKRVYVRLGKGNKPREIGINTETYELLLEYLKARLSFDSEYFFLNKDGKPFTVDRLNKKISGLANKLGFKGISPHSLRRSFVTINAAKGRPLNHLRIACGHADLSTTQGYCMTSVDEVVAAMREW